MSTRQSSVVALLLSYRAAASLLGIGRGQSLHALIASGLLKPVTLLGRSYIPRAQIEELAQRGEAPAPSPKPAPRAKRRASRSIRDIAIT